jgi:hypothetical protein
MRIGVPALPPALQIFFTAADRLPEADAMRWSCLAAMSAVFAGGMILAPIVRAADPLWAYTHPEAKVLIGIEWQRAKSSVAGQMVRRQLSELGGSVTGASQGLDFIESIDRILLSAPGELGGNPADSPVLVALQGRLDRAALRKAMIPGTAVERYKGLDLLIPPRGAGQDMVAALVNDTLTLLGDRLSIELALSGGHGLRDAALRGRAEQMAAECDFWMIAAVPPVKSGIAPMDNPLAASFDNLLSMDLGLSLANGLGLKVNMEFTDAASAQSLALGTQMITSMLMGGPASSPEMSKIARSLNVEQTGPQLRFSLDIPMDLLEQGVMQARAGFEEAGPRTLEGLLGMRPQSGLVPGTRPTVTQPVAAAMPLEPQKRTIRIVGLADGDREIDYTVSGRRR